MKAETIKEFYNSTFFTDESESKEVSILVNFLNRGGSILLPEIMIYPEMTIDQIFKKAHQYLLDNPADTPLEESVVLEEEKEVEKIKALNLHHRPFSG